MNKDTQLREGRISANRRGFAFLLSEGREPDIFVPEREARKVLHGDLVLLKRIRRKKKDKYFGKIIKVIEPGKRKILGRVSKNGGINIFEPIQDIITNYFSVRIPEHLNFTTSSIIECEIQRDSDGFLINSLKFLSILQEKANRTNFVDLTIRNYELPDSWSEDVIQETKLFKETISPEVISTRKDMRAYPFVTIDGEDARDYDDAIFVEKNDGYFDLYVAIADVAEFVKPNTRIDEEAMYRGTSVYFSSFVLPMLPETLSNNLCSLKPNVDRLVIIVHCKLDLDGNLVSKEFYEGVICSKARLTYEQVQRFYDSNESSLSVQTLDNLRFQRKLYKLLLEKRKARFALAIDNVEANYTFNDSGGLSSINHQEKKESQGVVEECMICADIAVATFLKKEKQTAIFRHHPEPESDKLLQLNQEALKLSFREDAFAGNARKLCNMILEKTYDSEKRHYYSLMVKRTQSLAFYSASESNHFGLSLDSYTHFTSPIRRYCDLIVHRILKARISGDKLGNESWLAPICSMISRSERRAEEATREEMQYLKAEFLSTKIGEEFEGFVTNLTDDGIVVQVFSHMVEGFVLRSKKQKSKYMSSSHLETGTYLRLVLTEVDMRMRKIFFKLK